MNIIWTKYPLTEERAYIFFVDFLDECFGVCVCVCVCDIYGYTVLLFQMMILDARLKMY